MHLKGAKMTRRVVVTGIGVVAPNGVGKQVFWDALVTGKSGIGPITRVADPSLPCNAVGEVTEAELVRHIRNADSYRNMARFSQLAVAAARLAADDARLDDRSAAVCIGTAAQGSSDI